MLNVDPLCKSQLTTPKFGDDASESFVSTTTTLDPETVISYDGVLRKNASTVCIIWLRVGATSDSAEFIAIAAED